MPPCIASPINDEKNAGMTTTDDASHSTLEFGGDGDGSRKALFSSDKASVALLVSVASVTNKAAATSIRSSRRSPRKRKGASFVRELQTHCEEGMYWSVVKRPTLSLSSSLADPVVAVAVAVAVVEKLQPQPHLHKDDDDDGDDGDDSKLSNETTIVAQPSNISDSATETEEQSVTSSVMTTTTAEDVVVIATVTTNEGDDYEDEDEYDGSLHLQSTTTMTASNNKGDGDDGGSSSLQQPLSHLMTTKSSSPMTMMALMDTSSSYSPPKVLVETSTSALKTTSSFNIRWAAETKDKHGECGDVQPTMPLSFTSPATATEAEAEGTLEGTPTEGRETPTEEEEDDIGGGIQSPPRSSKSSSRSSMLLRPPSTIKKTPGSILRRKCKPAKEGDIYDGTTRELSAIEPTSDRHFDALVAFATSTNSPSQNSASNSPLSNSPSKVTNKNENATTTTTNEDDDDDDELKQVVSQEVVLPPKKIIVVDSDTLRERLEVLFPDKFPPPRRQQQQQQPTQRKIRLRLNHHQQQQQQLNTQKKSSPPCILPRLIACYTMYRDQQNQSSAIEDIYPIHNLLQKLVDLEWTVLEGHEHLDDEEESLSSSPSNRSNYNNYNNNNNNSYQDYFPPGGTSNNCWNNNNNNSSAIISQEDKSDNDTTDGSEVSDRGDRDNQQDNMKSHTRRVQFAAFDDTAVVRGPSDVLEGSYKPQENCVQLLMDVLDVVEELFPQASGVHVVTTEENIITATTTPTATAHGSRSPTVILQDIISYLDNEFLLNGHDTTCVESIMEMNYQSIPIRRIEKAAIAYSRDLHSLINPYGKFIKKTFAIACATNAEGEHNFHDNEDDEDADVVGKVDTSTTIIVPIRIEATDVFVRSCPLSWECRLANASAQLVRYWLRTLLNPIPGRADFETKTDQWSSRLYDYVILTLDDSSGGGDDNINNDDDDSNIETYDEDNLSSLLSNALQHVYMYLGIDSTTTTATGAAMLSWKDRLLQVLPDESCCDTSVCREGLGSGRHPTYITEDDWEDVEQHLTIASDFCAFYRRAVFIESLLSIVTRMNWDDHWSNTVQAAAKKLVRLDKNSIIKNNNSINNNTSSGIVNEDDDGNDIDIDQVSDDIMVVNGGADSNNVIIQPEDEHLVLLGMPIDDLLYRLRTEILPISRERYGVCYNNLRTTETNFRLGLSNTKRKKKCQPQIQKLEDYWNEWLRPGTIFPSISFRGSSSS